jgi:hypothetical protein
VWGRIKLTPSPAGWLPAIAGQALRYPALLDLTLGPVWGRCCARYAGYASYSGSNPNKLAKPQNLKTAQLARPVPLGGKQLNFIVRVTRRDNFIFYY